MSQSKSYSSSRTAVTIGATGGSGGDDSGRCAACYTAKVYDDMATTPMMTIMPLLLLPLPPVLLPRCQCWCCCDANVRGATATGS